MSLSTFIRATIRNGRQARGAATVSAQVRAFYRWQCRGEWGGRIYDGNGF